MLATGLEKVSIVSALTEKRRISSMHLAHGSILDLRLFDHVLGSVNRPKAYTFISLDHGTATKVTQLKCGHFINLVCLVLIHTNVGVLKAAI